MAISYKRTEDFDKKKAAWLSLVKNSNNGVIPNGWDNDIFLSSVFKIFEYMKAKYGLQTISARNVPDSADFNSPLDEFTIIQLICNRLLKNVKSFEVDEKSTSGDAMGFYNPAGKKVTIVKNLLDANIQKTIANFKGVEFASEKDAKDILFEECVIHELLHAITDNGKALGFQTLNTADGTSFNEGLTESIAMDIAGLSDAYLQRTVKLTDGSATIVNTNTSSGYALENNIITLARIAKKNILTGYLVDSEHFMFERAKNMEEVKAIYGRQRSVGFIIEQLDKIRKNKKISKNTQNSEEKAKIQKENVEILQDLQSKLIEDIFTFKFKEFTDKIRKTGTVSKEEFDEMKKEVLFVGKCLTPKMQDETTLSAEEKNSFSTSLDEITTLVKDGKIEKSKNVDNYISLLRAMTSVEQDLKQDLKK